MSRRLIVRPEAEADLDEAAQWYERQKAGLGFGFTAAAKVAVRRAVENPLANRLMRRRPQVRRVPLERFPYRVFFIVRPDAIVVFAIVHDKQSERRWQERV